MMVDNTVVQVETVFLTEEPPEDDRIDRLIYWGKRFHDLGLAQKSAGNLSFRTKDGFIITGTGVELEAIKREKLVEVNGTDREIETALNLPPELGRFFNSAEQERGKNIAVIGI